VRFEISIGKATSNIITGHTTPAEAVEDIRTGKWSKQIAALRACKDDSIVRRCVESIPI
jgi:hypothetical protein